MNDFFQDISIKQNLIKNRYVFIGAALCSPIFYFFMKHIEIGSTDNLSFRVAISVISILGFWTTFIPSFQKNLTVFFYHLVRVCYLGVYLYLLYINHWTMYQRWSYFVLGAILCGSPLSWNDYLAIASTSIIAPIIMGLVLPSISTIELIHFHTANITSFVIIGLSVRAHYHFKNEVGTLANSLIEKSQMAVLGEIAAGVSHEVNSPLMIIRSSLDQLNRNLNQEQFDREKINVLTEKMYRMIERISNIVNSLKAYSSEKTDAQYERADLVTLIEESLTLSNGKFIDSGITITKDIPAGEIICMVKKSHIIQCFLNLFNNAIEACREMPSPQITISAYIKNSYVYVLISDNGPGVSKELVTKIMHPFFTTKEIGKGSGLGLSVSQGIAMAHNGELYLDPSISFSTFVLKLPTV